MTVSKHAPFFFVEQALLPDQPAVIRGTDARHLRVVRRATVGDRITLSDGHGKVAKAEVTRLESSAIEVLVGETIDVARSVPHVSVFQGLARGSKLEFTIQKLVELGVDSIEVFLAGRSVPRWNPARAQHALERWDAVAREAAKQSHRAWLPEVRGPYPFDRALEATGAASLALLLHEGAQRRLREALPSSVPSSLALFVGPEGGFTQTEVEALVGAGASSVSLGSSILRTETAAMAAVSALLYHFGLFG